jgi:hypothetical protein
MLILKNKYYYTVKHRLINQTGSESQYDLDTMRHQQVSIRERILFIIDWCVERKKEGGER